MAEKEPEVTISELELNNSGFTISGKERFTKSIKDYSKVLFDKSINYGDIDKALNREVTHEHVKAAAPQIANSFGKPTTPKYMWVVKVGQYLCAALVGISTNHLDKTYGAIGFVVSFSIGGVLLYIQTSKSK